MRRRHEIKSTSPVQASWDVTPAGLIVQVYGRDNIQSIYKCHPFVRQDFARYLPKTKAETGG